MKNIFLILCSFCVFATAEAQWVVTVAGVLETPGFNDGPALSSRFFNPHGIAIDSSGVVYVADRFNHLIRKYDPIMGTVETLAGKAGEMGDVDGQGSEARFSEPWAICVTAGGIIYVADTKNNKIKKVTQNGVVSTIAGTGNFGVSDGSALSSTFGAPSGIEITEGGIIYVADHNTHIIRKIENGQVSTLAGFPYVPGDADGVGNEAQFWRPYGLTLDNEENILVADEWNHKIRKVAPDGTVTTVAGNGEAGLTNGQGADARFYFPWDLTVDPNGNIYVADGYNYVVRLIESADTVSSFAGKPQVQGGQDGVGEDASFSGATSLAWNSRDSAVYVGDAYNHLIRAIYVYGLPIPQVTLEISTGSPDLCEGDDVSITASPDFYSDYKFFLNGQLVQEGAETSFSLSNLQAGQYSINVVADADTSIVSSNLVTLNVTGAPSPSISAVGPLDFYEGDSVILVANGTGEFFWSNGSDEQTITVTESGTYTVEETENGCTGVSDPVVVNVIPLPDGVTISMDGEPEVCPGQTLRLVSSYTNGNQWLKDGWPINGATSQFYEVEEGGFYQIQFTDPFTNISIISEGVEVQFLPESEFDFDASPRQGFAGQAITFFNVGADVPASFNWEFGDGDFSQSDSPVHVFDSVGAYTVLLQATDVYGCTYDISKSQFISIVPDGTVLEDDIFFPTAFTPNGDGVNDVFRVRGSVVGSFYLAVFDQWGEPLFISEDPNNGWDGYQNGQKVESGTYAYMVQAETLGGPRTKSGLVTLIR